MSSKINAISTGVGGLATSADASGILEIQTNDITAVTVDGSQVVSFDNNFGTVAGLPSYQCRAWVNFNGTGTVAIRASGNVSSITDNGTGDYTVNFTNAMPDVNYSPIFGASPAAGFSGSVGSWWLGVSLDGSGIPRTKTTSALRIISTGASGSLVDSSEVNLSIFR